MICFRAITLQDTTFVKEETCNRIKLQLAWRHTPDSHAFLMPAITGNPMLRLSGSCARPGAASPSTANCARVTIFSPWQRHQNCLRRLRRCPSKNLALMYGQPGTWHALMNKLPEVVSRYLVAQVEAGVDVVQVFDSWVGALGPGAYKRFVQPYTQRVFEAVKQTGTPSIHFGTGTASLLELMAQAGGDIISVDWRVNLDDAWARIGYERGIQCHLVPSSDL